jgi:esterase/lipase
MDLLKEILKWLGIILLVFLAIILVLGLIPVSTAPIESNPNPAGSYEEAMQRFDAVEAGEEGILMSLLSASQLMTHGEKTDKAYVLIHGWTNSPHQWVPFGQLLFDRGHNVLILRIPYHGLESHDVAELAQVTPEELGQYADDAVDLAAGLGEEINVVGLSVGGEISSWIAQNRDDVNVVMPISPLFGLDHLPAALDYFLINLASRFPNINLIEPGEPVREHVYRGESSKGVAEALRFGQMVFGQAKESAPAVSEIIVVTNDNDTTVDNRSTNELADLWEASGETVTRYAFPKELGFPHNSIDPTSNPETDIVYAKLLELLGEKPLE